MTCHTTVRVVFALSFYVSFGIASGQVPALIEFKDNTLVTGNSTIKAPITLTALTEVWGKPDRSVTKLNLIHTWDKLGIVALQSEKEAAVSEIQFHFAPEQVNHYPRSGYSGELGILGRRFNGKSNQTSLSSAGLKQSEVLREVLPIYYSAKRGDVTYTARFDGVLNCIAISPPTK